MAMFRQALLAIRWRCVSSVGTALPQIRAVSRIRSGKERGEEKGRLVRDAVYASRCGTVSQGRRKWIVLLSSLVAVAAAAEPRF